MAVEPTIIWSPQPGPQTDLVTCPIFEVFYGGARGGGKTDGSIGDWISHSHQYGENAIGLFVRRRLTQLSEAIARAKFLCLKLGGRWYEQKKELVMSNGARLRFAYLERDTDAEEYQGHNYTRLYIEEATNFPFPDPIMKLKGTLRSTAGVPCGIRLTGNPGGPGHHWVKDRYINPCPTGYLVIREEEEVEIEPGVFVTAFIERVFIPAKLKDNQKLLKNDPSYILRLRQTGSEALVKAWLEGDWNGVDGTFFSEFLEAKHVITGNLIIPPHVTRFRALDWGSAAPFSVGWYAVSDGTFGFAKDALIKYQEWYGWTGKPNVGLKMSANLVGQGVVNRDGAQKPSYGVADPSIFSNNGGPSIAEMMMVEKCIWFRGDNARQAGWEQMRKRLASGDDASGTLLLFHESCDNTIRTLPYLQHDDKNSEDLDTDAEDHCFVAGTLIQTAEGVFPIESLTKGTLPTLFGALSFKQMKTGTQVQLVELRYTDGSTTICTPSHKFLTPSGWVRAASLEGHSVCLQSSFPQPFKNMLASAFTCAGTISKIKTGVFTALSGVRQTALSLMATTFTTKTGILQTTPWKILNACPGTTIFPSTLDKTHKSLGKLREMPQQSGTPLGKAMLGTASSMKSTVERLWRKFKKTNLANIAGKYFLQKAARPTNSVQMPVEVPTVARQELTTLQEFAAFVARHFSSTNTNRLKNVVSVTPAGKGDVYCLSVPGAGHFYLADGQIVSNCADETRYAVMSRPMTRYETKRVVQDVNLARARPTINELISRQARRNALSSNRY